MEIAIDKQNLTPRIKKTGVLVYSELTNTLFIKSKNKGVMQIGSSFSSGDFVEKTTTIDINGVVQDLSTSRTWTIFVPTKTSELTNDSGFITTADLSSYLTITSAAATYQPIGSYLTSITSSNVTTALGYTPVTNARTLTINGTTYDLTADRSWTISTGTTYTFSTGLTNTAGTITSNLSTGVSGGQSVVGGTSSGNNLTLSSTSNATKGKILFGTSAYDEVNNRLGIGTTTPTSSIEIANGGTLKLGGGTAMGQGNILMNSNASIYYDSNVTYLGSNSQTMGMIASSTPAFLSSNGPSIFFRGNSYVAISGQRGIAGMMAGNPSSPIAGEGELRFYTGSNALRMVIGYNGNVGIGQSSPTAVLHLKAGTATANTAPLKFTTGTNTTVAEAGQIEYNNTFHLTNSDATRRHIVTAPNTTKVTTGAPNTNDGYVIVNIGGIDFKLMTCL